MIPLFALCVFSLRKPKVVRSNLTMGFHLPKSVKVEIPPGCDALLTQEDSNDYIDDCLLAGDCTWGQAVCKALFQKEYNGEELNANDNCIRTTCQAICKNGKGEFVDWCHPRDPLLTVDQWKTIIEGGEQGCVGADTDVAIEKSLEECKDYEEQCENKCKGAWKADAKLAGVDCWQDDCDKICKKNRFSWCKGLSAGAIAGIVVACVVVVGAAVGAVVYFVVIRPKKAQVAAPD
jgi:hypothetical protein